MNVRRSLDAAGRQDAPPPDPAFVRDLEARLGSGRVAAAPAARRRPLLPVAAAVVAVGAMVGLVLGLQADPAPDRVQTEPNPSVTTSTIVGPSTTTTVTVVAPPPASSTTTTTPPVTVP
ncbi:MAG: hypothetical protein JWO68_2198, partial [Actinomycetia bacterium]|nr:hypothetical protein [Actinomycetes bacterium]